MIFQEKQSCSERLPPKLLRHPRTVFGMKSSAPSVCQVSNQITKIVHACHAAVNSCTLLACSKFVPTFQASGPAPIAELSFKLCKYFAFLSSLASSIFCSMNAVNKTF
jgi:hypothetical protein